MTILVIGYPLTRPNYRRALEAPDTYFIVPAVWKIKGGKAEYRTEPGSHIATTWAPFSHSGYPIIGGLLKGWMPMFPWLLWKMKRKHGVRLVFEAHEPTLLTTLFHGIAVKALGLKYVVFSWENIPFEKKLFGLRGTVHRLILSTNLALADGVVCGNEKCLAIFQKLTAKPLAHIPLAGVDPERFKPPVERVAHEQITFLFAGAVDRRKGLHILLPAFKEVLKEFPRAQLIIIGSGTYEKHLQAQIEDLQVPVTRLPWADHARLIELMAQSDVFVYPSISHGGWEEQFGYSMAEASLMELPVIATRSGSIEEVVKGGQTGLLVEPENVQQLTDAMRILAADPERRRAYGRAGRDFIKSTFSNEATALRYRSFFSSIMQSRPSA